MAQIEIKNLTFTYPNQSVSAVSDFSLTVENGEVVVICGKTGCGKSTLLRNLKTAIRPAGKISGSVVIDGIQLDEIDRAEQCKKIGFVFQNPEHQIVTDKVWHELAFGLENLGEKSSTIRLKVAEIAQYFGICHWFDKKTSELSGGQKQILNLAAVMIMNPQIIVLDEPTAYLDPIAADNFIELVKKINRDFGITIIISEHKLENILSFADKLVVLRDGKQVECGNINETLGSLNNSDEIKIMPIMSQLYMKIDGTGKCPLTVEEGRAWLKNRDIGKVNFPKAHHFTEEIVTAKNLWFRYNKGDKDIIRGLNLNVMKGEIFAIVGGNGSGKTTTLSLLSQVNKPNRGKLINRGTTTLLPQDVQTLFCKETVREELSGVATELIKEMGLDKFMDSHPYDLSGGQQQKLALAKVLEQDADILLLDEPTKGLDGIYKEQLGVFLKRLSDNGKTVIMVSHDLDFCGKYANRCGMFSNGEIVSTDYVREFFSANNFYTTTVSKMARNVIENAVCEEDILQCIQV